MAVVNRCAIGVGPRDPLIEWSRQVSRHKPMEWGADDQSLYLIPTYETDEEALDLLKEGFEAIFAAELDSWCRDQSTWPSPRTFELFLEWFEIRFYPLVEDLCEEELERDEVDEDFIEQVRSALEDLPRN
jgi:hypothetical protein